MNINIFSLSVRMVSISEDISEGSQVRSLQSWRLVSVNMCVAFILATQCSKAVSCVHLKGLIHAHLLYPGRP
ncbi:hypothetical protein E2C01_010261 [Portunus trituberculatus]|uniref:Uncharacterized protein n=1 Tax=Portunus trituberculatus TaxID=210409 RepID=A0A5B7D875_PORTR|nr:hypothetical protein [Portunus trituberculatus]